MSRIALIPDEIRFLDLYGVLYYIPWEEVHPGCSFFLKTPASVKDIRKELTRAGNYLNMRLRAVQRVEFGYYGARVWRID